MFPFGVGKVVGITLFVALVLRAAIARPHRQPLPNQAASVESHTTRAIQLPFGQTPRECAQGYSLLDLMLMEFLHRSQPLNEPSARGIAHPRFHQPSQTMDAF
jgi:hypothetical protein